MRALLIRHGYFPDDPRVHREATALVGKGHHVELLCLRGPGERGSEIVDGVAVTRFPLGHRRSSSARYVAEYAAFFVAAAAAAAARHIARGYDVVQVHTVPDGLVFAALIPRFMGAKVILDLHELMPELYASKHQVSLEHPLSQLLMLQERLAVRFADKCIAVSHPCLDRFLSRGLPSGKFTVVMNSADSALFAPRAHELDGTEARPGRPDSGRAALRAVSHGTLVERYGYDTLIRALAELPEVHLDMIGDGDQRPSLERLARELGVESRITFVGAVPLKEVAARISGADLGVVPNSSDVFTDLVVPTKLLEYVALGIPAVVSRTPAVEAYFDDESVTYSRPGDASDLADKIRWCIEHPNRSRERAARARQRFAESIAWPIMRQRYLQMVEDLARGR